MLKASNGNYKNQLLEISASYFGIAQPEYFHFEYGPAHAKVFLCICSFQQKTTSHEGRTKIEAEQHASQEMLQILKMSLMDHRHEVSSVSNNGLVISPEIASIIETLGTDVQFNILSLYGDAVLRYHIAHYLFNKYPQFQEGILTRITSEALRIETRANLAQQLNMEVCISTEVTSRTLAQTFSAVIGKCALLYGDEFCSHFIQENYKIFIDLAVVHILRRRILDNYLAPASYIKTKIHNYKNELLEYAQKRGVLSPDYHLIEKTGEAHAPIFTVVCHLMSRESIGQGKTKKSAEQEASHKMLRLLKSMDVESTRCLMPTPSSRYSAYPFDEYSNEYQWNELKICLGWHHFNNTQHLQEAFTHPSKDPSMNYQRLEFLGDAILREVLLRYILQTYPGIDSKAEVSEKMSQIVSASIQAQIACQLNIEQYIASEAMITEAILSDVLEGLIAVIFLSDGVGKEAASACIITWFQETLDHFFPKEIETKNSLVTQTNDLDGKQQEFHAISKVEAALSSEAIASNQQLTYAQIVRRTIPHEAKPQFFKPAKNSKTSNSHDLKDFPPLSMNVDR